ncbi:hypothetical protein [Salmonirosea aquatica]|uniref:Uncharacterized protein n=1 Tax=Salmonirosea aquatica TaxID=2654236 RepID=A0A7C9FQJ2_9BACT|nr:hypothetical protein [Cytophagaceae bacterium SJW1-29]
MRPILSRIITLALFGTLCFVQGCIDHVPLRSTVLTTLPFEVQNGQFTFTIQGDQLGDSPVKEYGVVYAAYFRAVGNHN